MVFLLKLLLFIGKKATSTSFIHAKCNTTFIHSKLSYTISRQVEVYLNQIFK